MLPYRHRRLLALPHALCKDYLCNKRWKMFLGQQIWSNTSRPELPVPRGRIRGFICTSIYNTSKRGLAFTGCCRVEYPIRSADAKSYLNDYSL